LAAHLCGEHVNDLLNHEKAPKIDAFLQRLHEWGFRRVQVNATAVNGVFTDNLSDDSTLQSFLRTVNAHSNLEFIVQKNEETKPLWDALMKLEKPENVVFLHDESKGTGKVADSGWCDDKEFVCTARNIVGFAGVSNIHMSKNKSLTTHLHCASISRASNQQMYNYPSKMRSRHATNLEQMNFGLTWNQECDRN
jgi:hypothetical protein